MLIFRFISFFLILSATLQGSADHSDVARINDALKGLYPPPGHEWMPPKVTHVIGDVEFEADEKDEVVSLRGGRNSNLGVKLFPGLYASGCQVLTGHLMGLTDKGARSPLSGRAVIAIEDHNVRRYHILPMMFRGSMIGTCGDSCYVVVNDVERPNYVLVRRAKITDEDGALSKSLEWRTCTALERGLNTWLVDHGYEAAHLENYHIFDAGEGVLKLAGFASREISSAVVEVTGDGRVEQRVFDDLDPSLMWSFQKMRPIRPGVTEIRLPLRERGVRVILRTEGGDDHVLDAPNMCVKGIDRPDFVHGHWLLTGRWPKHGVTPILLEFGGEGEFLQEIQRGVQNLRPGFVPTMCMDSASDRISVTALNPLTTESLNIEGTFEQFCEVSDDLIVEQQMKSSKSQQFERGRQISYQPFVWRGCELPSTLVLPRGFRKPGPLVVFAHGGPDVTEDDNPLLEVLNAGGIATVVVNYPGATATSEAFRAGKAVTLDGQLDSLRVAARTLVESGVADPDRLGLLGYSWGGTLANYALARGGAPFRAICAAAGVSRLDLMDASEGSLAPNMLWQLDPDLNRAGVMARREALSRLSPLSRSMVRRDVSIASMILHGSEDRCVPSYQAELMHKALDRAGHDHLFVRVRGASHGLRSDPVNHERVALLGLGFFLESLAVPGKGAATFDLLRQIFIPRSHMMASSVDSLFSGVSSPMMRDVLGEIKMVTHPDLVGLHLRP